MSKKNILTGLGIIALSALVAFAVSSSKPTVNEYVGGSFNPVPVDFAKGITVNGTEVLNSSGVFTGAISGITGAFSSTLSAIGNLAINTNKFTVTASNGNTAVAGTLAVAGQTTFQRKIVTSNADATLTNTQSGTTFLTATAGVDWTLPAVATAAGDFYRFAISGNFATTSVTVNSAEGDNIEGSMIVAGAVVDCTANDVITFVNDGEDVGDYVELYSDGTTWFIGSSNGLTASKLTCSG